MEKDIILEINEVLDATVRPAIKNDGGDITVVDYDPDSQTVFVQLEGACVGCPMSQMTLKGGVERILTEKLDYVKIVEQV